MSGWTQYLEAPERFGLHCRRTNTPVMHRQDNGGMRCSACGRLVPASQLAIMLSVDEYYAYKQRRYRLQIPEPMLEAYIDDE